MTPRLLVLVTLAEAGGAQTFAATLVAGLRERYEIEVAAHGPGRGPRATPPRHWMCRSTTFATSCALRIPTTTLAAVRELRSLARRLTPDVVQINSSKAGVLGRLALAGLGARTVFTAHGWAFSGRTRRRGRLYTAGERAVAPLSDAIVCVSNHDLRLARERGIAPRSGLHVIHNGIDAAATLPPRRPPAGRLVLGCTARLAPPKDLTTLLDALARPGCEALGAARVRRRPRPRADRAASRRARPR